MSLVGEQVGHITLVGTLGAGGMGEVYLGYDERLERRVAVKTLRAERRLSREDKARFSREARLLSRLDHPGICRVHDLVETDTADFLVLELVEGRTLREVGPELDEAGRLDVAHQVALALAVAHEADVVHRDLKPENIMVQADGQVKVLDFGVACRAAPTGAPVGSERIVDVEGRPGSSAERLTRTASGELTASLDRMGDEGAVTLRTRAGSFVGTVGYMSPEQAAGLPVTAASDMYAFGVLLHELWTGRPAYGGASGAELVLKVYRGETGPLDGLDSGVAGLVARLESVQTDARPSAAGTASELAELIDRPRRRRRRRHRLAAVGGLAAVLVGAGAVVLHTRLVAGEREIMARSFAEEAKDIEWLMRVESLSPPHDMTVAAAGARRRTAALEARISALGPAAEGAGHYALGVAHLALREHSDAEEHLERAWAAGSQGPRTAYALGLAIGHRYQVERQRVDQIADPLVRGPERERIEAGIRDRAIVLLRASRGAEMTFPAYVDGLVALYEERFEDGLQAVSELRVSAPWFYDADLLAAELHAAMAGRAGLVDRAPERARELFETAWTDLERAVAVGRSDPYLARRRCWIGLDGVENDLNAFRLDGVATRLDQVTAACDAIEALEPGRPDTLALQSMAVATGALFQSRQGEDPVGAFEGAIELASRALAVEPLHRQALMARAGASYQLGFHQLGSGHDASRAFGQAITDYRVAVHLPSAFLHSRLQLADSLYGRAGDAWLQGEDPTPWLEEGLAVVEEALSMGPDNQSLWMVAGNLWCVQGRYDAGHGRDARAALGRSIEAYRRVAAGASHPETYRNLALVLTDLANAETESGEDPGDVLDEALVAAEKAIELNPTYGYPQLVEGLAHLARARYLLLSGVDAGDEVEGALTRYRAGLALAAYPDGPLDLARILLVGARNELAMGRSPVGSLADAREVLVPFLAAAAPNPEALRLAGEVDLLAARSEGLGADSGAERLERAVDLLERAVAVDPGESANHLSLAEARLWRVVAGRWADGEEVEAGLEAATSALAINPRLARAELVRAALLGLRNREDSGRPAVDDSEMAAALTRAFELNPLLDQSWAGLESSLGLRRPRPDRAPPAGAAPPASPAPSP